METGKLFVLLLFIINIITCQSQEKKEIPPPPPFEERTLDFLATELRVDTIFAHNLETVIFDVNERMQSLKKNTSQKEERNILLEIKKLDSLNYSLDIILMHGPLSINNGFYRFNNFYYWIQGELPSNIILKKGPKKRFKYKYVLIWAWYEDICKVIYNSQTGEFKLIESNQY